MYKLINTNSTLNQNLYYKQRDQTENNNSDLLTIKNFD